MFLGTPKRYNLLTSVNFLAHTSNHAYQQRHTTAPAHVRMCETLHLTSDLCTYDFRFLNHALSVFLKLFLS